MTIWRVPLFEDDTYQRVIGHQVEIRIGPLELEVDSGGGWLFWLDLPGGRYLSWEDHHWPSLGAR